MVQAFEGVRRRVQEDGAEGFLAEVLRDLPVWFARTISQRPDGSEDILRLHPEADGEKVLVGPVELELIQFMLAQRVLGKSYLGDFSEAGRRRGAFGLEDGRLASARGCTSPGAQPMKTTSLLLATCAASPCPNMAMPSRETWCDGWVRKRSREHWSP